MSSDLKMSNRGEILIYLTGAINLQFSYWLVLQLLTLRVVLRRWWV